METIKTAGEATYDAFGRLENGGELPAIPSTEFTHFWVNTLDTEEVYDRIPDALFARVGAAVKV